MGREECVLMLTLSMVFSASNYPERAIELIRPATHPYLNCTFIRRGLHCEGVKSAHFCWHFITGNGRMNLTRRVGMGTAKTICQR